MSLEEIKDVLKEIEVDLEKHGIWRASWKKTPVILDVPERGWHLVGYPKPRTIGFTFILKIHYENEEMEE